jgi:hypothetical protein
MFHNIQTEVNGTNRWFYERRTTYGEGTMINKLKNMIASHFMEVYEIKKLAGSEKAIRKSKVKNNDAEYCSWD